MQGCSDLSSQLGDLCWSLKPEKGPYSSAEETEMSRHHFLHRCPHSDQIWDLSVSSGLFAACRSRHRSLRQT